MPTRKPPSRNPSFGNAIGMQLDARPNRNVGSPGTPPPAQQQVGQGDRTTEIYTLFTLVGPQGSLGTPILYNAERYWAQVTLTLETAGPVAVGTRADLFPVLSGKGALLTTGVPSTFTIGKGYSRLYYAATAVNRVRVEIQPFAWLEQIMGNAEASATASAAMTALLQLIARK